jgi:hypothetical protein
LAAGNTAEVKNERAFKQIIAIREGELMAMQKVSEVIKQVLADPTVESPINATKTELTRLILAGAGKRTFPRNQKAMRKWDCATRLQI